MYRHKWYREWTSVTYWLIWAIQGLYWVTQTWINHSQSLSLIKRKSLIRCVGVGKHAKWIFFECYLDTFSTRCQKDFFPRPHLVPKNHLQNIAKIGPFWADFWRPRFSMGQLGPECHFLTFWALQHGFFRFFSKNIKFAFLISKSLLLWFFGIFV